MFESPVVRVSLPRLAKMVGARPKRILDRIPYVGLDIESVTTNSVRVEYSPNRPDFGTDFGIARALRGLLGKEVGLPRYPLSASGLSVTVDRRLSKVRPFIACTTATGLHLDDEDIRQIISLQEDLHNGLGRKRKAAAIGLHDMKSVAPPFSYHAVDQRFKFAPLGAKKPSTIGTILSRTKEGRDYGGALGDSGLFPVITDSTGVVLSFPPIINGNATKVTTNTKNMFIDVTSTKMKSGDDALAIMATTLAEAGAKIGTVSINYSGSSRTTPGLTPLKLPLDYGLIRSVLGMSLTRKQVEVSLERSRMSVEGRNVLAPRYRTDLLHPVDIAEEVALGYGFDRIDWIYPPSPMPGSFNQFEEFLDSVSTVMAGAGMIELMTYELMDEKSLYSNFDRPSLAKVSVSDPRSAEHSVLRDALIPSLMSALSSNVKADYPQRVFEIGRVFGRSGKRVTEAWHLAALIAHSNSSYSEAMKFLEATSRIVAGREMTAAEGDYWAFAPGRSATVRLGRQVGNAGEIKPESLEAFGMRVPVAGFEVDLSSIFEGLK